MQQPALTRTLGGHALAPPALLLNAHYLDSVPHIEASIKRKCDGSDVRILEAGCGALWPLRLEGVPYKLTAVDIDVKALERRKQNARDIDEIRVGDLLTPDLFAPASFDVIYNSFVLEHIDGAERVLDHFLTWLAPGGLMILRFPDRDTVYAFLTRFSPFWLHVLYKRYVQGMPHAGEAGHGPYRTYHDEVVSRRGIHRYCNEHGCRVHYEAGFAGYLPRQPLLGALTKVLVQSISVLSFGRLEWRYNNLTLIIER